MSRSEANILKRSDSQNVEHRLTTGGKDPTAFINIHRLLKDLSKPLGLPAPCLGAVPTEQLQQRRKKNHPCEMGSGRRCAEK